MVEIDASAIVPLRASRSAFVQVGRARQRLRRRGLLGLGQASDAPGRPGWRAYRCDLRLPVRALRREVEFRKAAIIEIGPVRSVGEALGLDISWRSATLAPLFPVFAGQLTIKRDRIELNGWYAPPGGHVGVALDRMLLGVAARGTAAWLLGAIVAELGPARSAADDAAVTEGSATKPAQGAKGMRLIRQDLERAGVYTK